MNQHQHFIMQQQMAYQKITTKKRSSVNINETGQKKTQIQIKLKKRELDVEHLRIGEGKHPLFISHFGPLCTQNPWSANRPDSHDLIFLDRFVHNAIDSSSIESRISGELRRYAL